MAPTFGDALRELRLAAGISLGELARQVNYSKAYMSRLESGQRAPNAAVARLCDSALASDGQLVAMFNAQTPGEVTAAKLDDEVWKLDLSEDGETWFRAEPKNSFDRAELMGFAQSRMTHGSIDNRALDALRGAFEQCVTLGKLTSPVAVLGMLITHTNTLRSLIGVTPEPLRAELTRLASRSAGFISWMSQEAGDERAATWWSQVSADFADTCGDVDLWCDSIVRQAEIALCRHDPVTATKLIDQARAVRGVDWWTVKRVALREAASHAVAGDARGYEEALDRADAFPDDAGNDQSGGIGCFPDDMELARGWCLFELGRPKEAAEVLAREVVKIDSSDLRSRVRFTLKLALARVYDGDFEQACRDVENILADVARVDSATARADGRELVRALARWRTSDTARNLSGQLLHLIRAQ